WNNQIWHQGSPGVWGEVEPDDAFGSALAAGDFNGDGYTDLAIGVPGESVNGRPGAGAVNVLYGSRYGLTAAGNQIWTEESLGLDASEKGDHFGASLAVGDFD